MVLDDIDVTILDLLQKAGRTRRNELAELVGLSLPAASERLRKLEEANVITGYHATLNSKLLGKDITAFVTVTIDSSKHFAAFVEHVNSTDDILECHGITGEGTHLLKVRTENTESLEKLLGKVQSWLGVAKTTTSMVLSTSKETTKVKVHKSR